MKRNAQLNNPVYEAIHFQKLSICLKILNKNHQIEVPALHPGLTSLLEMFRNML